jgi:hypothetical protein
MYTVAPGPISTACLKIPPISLCVCVCIPQSLLGNSTVNTFPFQQIHATI